MKKVKKTFKRFGSIFAVILVILIMTILPALAVMDINITVWYIGSYTTGFNFRTSDAESFTTYQENSQIVASSEFNAECYVQLTNDGILSGYDGFLIYLTSAHWYTDSQNLAPSYFTGNNLFQLADGSLYVESGKHFYFYKDTQDLYLTVLPVNYQRYISNISQSDYDRGLRDGLAEQSARITELESQVAALANSGSTAAEKYMEGYKAGYDYSDSQYDYVTDVTTTVLDGTGKTIQTMLDLQVFGIHLYQIALLAAAIPLTIFLIRICLRH